MSFPPFLLPLPTTLQIKSSQLRSEELVVDSGLGFQVEPAMLDGAARSVYAELCPLLQIRQQIKVAV